jgi:hypothetical protein
MLQVNLFRRGTALANAEALPTRDFHLGHNPTLSALDNTRAWGNLGEKADHKHYRNETGL